MAYFLLTVVINVITLTCHYVAASILMTKEVGTYKQCYNYCAAISVCQGVEFIPGTGSCNVLSSSVLSKRSDARYGDFSVLANQVPHEICRARPCQIWETCVMTSSGTGHVCLLNVIGCGSPTSHPNMAGTAPSTTTGATATYSCNVGYTGSGSGTSTCQADGNWGTPSLTCTVVDCTSPTSHPNMVSSSPSTVYGATATYSCKPGYTGSGSGTSTCQADGNWSTPFLTCTAMSCGSPTSHSNMAGIASSTTTGATATYSCNVGYTGSGSGTSTCQTDGNWSTPSLTCTVVDCSSPTSHPNMVSSSPSTVYGATATYSCKPGYTGSGSGTSTCQTDGNWSIPSLTCTAIGCGSPTSHPNMAGIASSTTTGATATYSCNVGYSGTGSGTSTCQTDGNWSTPSLTCTAIGCGSPTSHPNMAGIASSTTTGATATYSCNVGYTGSGSGTSTCQTDGNWSTPSLTCTAIGCGSPTSHPNMAGIASSTTTGATATYSCNVGYSGTGSGTSTCQTDGNWSTPPLTCTVVNCGSPTSHPNMAGASPSTVYGAAATYSCNVGYTGSGSGTSTCQADGNWSTPSLTCTIVDCTSPTSHPNMAGSSPSSTVYGATATYSCNMGYSGSGSGTSTCQADGSWSTPSLTCTAIGCGSPTSHPNMAGAASSTTTGATATYSCNVGYTGSGSGTSTCQTDGNWSTPPLTCTIVDCSSPTSYPNMIKASFSTVYGATATYSCNVGYTGSGSGTSTCQADGSWSTPSLTCTVVNCGSPTTHSNMAGASASTVYGSTATYSCNVGYTGSGSGTSTCQADGNWSTPSLICTVVDCGSPTSHPNMGGASPSTVHGATATYSCNVGYTGSGSGTSTCQTDGNWSTPSLTCTVVDCSSPTSHPNMADASTSTVYGATATYSCNVGYTGSGSGTSTCQADGNWSTPSLTCTIVDCSSPTSHPNMADASTSTVYGATATYSCNVGYTGSGSGTSTCQADGNWSTPSLTCTIVNCGSLTSYPKMTGALFSTVYGSTATYSCNVGYTGSGSGTSTCQADGNWSTPSLTCTATDCGTPTDTSNHVVVSYSTTTAGSSTKYACGLGLKETSGDAGSTCTGGSWSTPPLTCTGASNVQTTDEFTGSSSVWVCQERVSGPSGTSDDSLVSIQCQGDEVMTGCTSLLDQMEPDADGHYVDTDNGRTRCTAVNSWGTSGPVRARARCCSVDNLKCEYLTSGYTSHDNDVQQSTSCKTGFWPTGCTFLNWFGESDGVFLTDAGCTVQNSGPNAGTTGDTICCSAPNMDCVNVVSAPSGHNNGDYTGITCPDGYTMTGCMVYTPDNGIRGAKIEVVSGKDTCFAVNGKWKSSSKTPPVAHAACCTTP